MFSYKIIKVLRLSFFYSIPCLDDSFCNINRRARIRNFLLKEENFVLRFQNFILKLQNCILKLEIFLIKFRRFLCQRFYRFWFIFHFKILPPWDRE